MRVLVQRVSNASVAIDGKIHASIRHGILVFLGIEHDDTEEDAKWLCGKLGSLRIFADKDGVMNLSVNEVNGEALVISQFTLHAKTKKGNRPSYIQAARPEKAIPLYGYFAASLAQAITNKVFTGVFGADMQVQLTNDGPVTIWIDSKQKE